MSETVWDEQFAQTSDDVELGIEVDDERPSDALVSLLTVGRLSREFVIGGNSITLRTLTMDEELEIGLLIKPYSDTEEAGRAYICAVVASSIETVNGQALVTILGLDTSYQRKQFDYVRKTWFWPVIERVYEEGYIPLQRDQLAALEEFRKKSPASLTT